MPGDVEHLRELYAEWAEGDFSRNDLFDTEVVVRSHGYPEAVGAQGLEQLKEVLADGLSHGSVPMSSRPRSTSRRVRHEVYRDRDQALAALRLGAGEG